MATIATFATIATIATIVTIGEWTEIGRFSEENQRGGVFETAKFHHF